MLNHIPALLATGLGMGFRCGLLVIGGGLIMTPVPGAKRAIVAVARMLLLSLRRILLDGRPDVVGYVGCMWEPGIEGSQVWATA